MVGRYGTDRDIEHVNHIKFCGFACDEVFLVTVLARHLVSERNAFGFGGDDIVVFRCNFEQVARAAVCELGIAEYDEPGDRKRFVERAYRQAAGAAGYNCLVILLRVLFHNVPSCFKKVLLLTQYAIF